MTSDRSRLQSTCHRHAGKSAAIFVNVAVALGNCAQGGGFFRTPNNRAPASSVAAGHGEHEGAAGFEHGRGNRARPTARPLAQSHYDQPGAFSRGAL